ncbi:hypothetical protein M011DRAFT_494895 [Sporormia fimetaria CBS 119925]|uniref:Uncharacterized protein n=1 Tax=Sporormia fimetaria CBS 119925 TaxID=1340428 RepID=A0A6A6VCE2_9PLEO|nr:hypothetical protein M011DRAFT_494895 [Sporormia fimetaria CBS 119925]
MFCLRGWIPVLFFLLRTNPTPIYTILFLTSTYFFNRPCVYCSILLLILVLALFDFQTPWFESASPSTNSTIADSVKPSNAVETAAVFAQAASQTAQAVARAAVENVKVRIQGEGETGSWVKAFLQGRKEWRVPCLDVVIRL